MAGQESTYWALANVPAGYTGAITGIFPIGRAPDLTQNAVAVDVARARLRRAASSASIERHSHAEPASALPLRGLGPWRMGRCPQ